MHTHKLQPPQRAANGTDGAKVERGVIFNQQHLPQTTDGHITHGAVELEDRWEEGGLATGPGDTVLISAREVAAVATFNPGDWVAQSKKLLLLKLPALSGANKVEYVDAVDREGPHAAGAG
eukprot:5534614-Prymnesium_polylepis.2